MKIMDNEKVLIEFFKEIKKFKENQNKQKQRGLNDFNILTAVRKPHAEVGMHSNFLYALLNPDGLHYQDDLFVNIFVKYVLCKNDFGKILKVSTEEPTKENRRIDFTIKSEKYYIGIEMKIHASDQEKQIYDYYTFLKNEANKDKNQEVIIYYLTLDGKEPSKESINGLDKQFYQNISFQKEIFKWLEKCQEEVANITNLNEAIKQYMDVVKMAIGKYEGKVMGLEKLLEDEEKFNLAKDISIAYEKIKLIKINKQKDDFLDTLEEKLREKLSYDYNILDWKALDITSLSYHIRIIPQEFKILFQVTNTKNPFEVIDNNDKNGILVKLQQINNNFKSSYNKVYGAVEIEYNDIGKIIDILEKI